MSLIENELQAIGQLPLGNQVVAYRDLHNLVLRREAINIPVHLKILEALLRSEDMLNGGRGNLVVFAAAMKKQAAQMSTVKSQDPEMGGGAILAGILNSLAGVLFEIRRFDEALLTSQKALNLMRANTRKGHPYVAQCLFNLALVLYELRRFDEALVRHEDALLIRRSELPANHPDILASLSRSADVLYELRQFEEALARHEEALAIRKATFSPSHPSIADGLDHIAVMLSRLRRFDEALTCYDEALAIKRATLLAGDLSIAVSLLNRANVLSELHQFQDALEQHQEALKIFRAVLPAGHASIAQSLNSLAIVLFHLRRFEEAAASHAEALRIRQAALPVGHPDIAGSSLNLANALFQLDRIEDAISLYQDALAIQRTALPAGHPDISNSLNNLANAFFKLGHFGEALPLYQEALAIRQGALPAGHPDTASSLLNLANVFRELRRMDEALLQIVEALHILLSNEQFSRTSKQLWGQPAESLPATLTLLLEIATRPDAHRLSSDAITVLLTYKGNADIEQGLLSILHANATGPFRARLERLHALQAEMARLQYTTDPQDVLRSKNVSTQLQVLERQVHTDPEGGRLAQELQLRMITGNAVRDALQENEALLNLFVLNDTVYAQLLHQDGRHHLHRYVAAELEARVAQLRSVLGDTAILLHEAALLQPLQALYSALITPIAGMLGLETGLKSLIISGDGFLYGLPWDLLCTPSESGAHPLLSQVSTRLMPTPRDLVRLNHFQAFAEANENPAVLLGVQSFDEPVPTDDEDRGPDTGELPSHLRSASTGFATRSAVFTGGGTTDLPSYGNLSGTEREIRTLTSLLMERGRSVVTHLSPNASEQTLLNIGMAPWVLHLSTHSDVWDAEQTRPLYRQVKQPDPRHDPAHPFSQAVVLLDGYTRRNFRGVMRAWELGSLNLRGTELVAFSSCNSGLGDMTAGRGVAGLSQAAFLAGAQRTLTSLWPVLDSSTPTWMSNVYAARLAGSSWQDAVQSEKLRMLEEEQPVSAWAPFVLNGLA